MASSMKLDTYVKPVNLCCSPETGVAARESTGSTSVHLASKFAVQCRPLTFGLKGGGTAFAAIFSQLTLLKYLCPLTSAVPFSPRPRRTVGSFANMPLMRPTASG